MVGRKKVILWVKIVKIWIFCNYSTFLANKTTCSLLTIYITIKKIKMIMIYLVKVQNTT